MGDYPDNPICNNQVCWLYSLTATKPEVMYHKGSFEPSYSVCVCVCIVCVFACMRVYAFHCCIRHSNSTHASPDLASGGGGGSSHMWCAALEW